VPSISAPESQAPTLTEQAVQSSSGHGNRYIVRLADGTEDVHGMADFLAAEHSGEVVGTVARVFRGFFIDLPSGAEASRLAQSSNVLYVEPDLALRLAGPEQSNPGWALDWIDTRASTLDQTYRYQHTGEGVHLYVIDTGIQDISAEFGSRLHQQAWAALPVVQAGCSANPYIDESGHGTRVASVAGSATFGVAKDVTLHSAKLESCDGSGTHSTSSIVAAMDWVADVHHSPAVVNYSGEGHNPTFPWQRSIADAMEGLEAEGVVVVKAAGNDGVDACTDAGNQVNTALIVGAVDSNGARSVWGGNDSSNWGSCISLFAPGTSVPALNTDGTAGVGQGTSIAAPFVAGTAALAREANPTEPPSFVRADIGFSATPDSLDWASLNGSPNLLVYPLRTRTWISGPSQVTTQGPHSWFSNPSGGHGNHSWSHEWYESIDGSPYTLIGTGSSVDITFPWGYCATHVIRLHSTYGADTVTNSMVVHVSIDQCPT
jgi:subtilisin family serine protease